MMDVALLSRVQFALTAAFHYVFPPLTIGLGLMLVVMEWRWLRTGDADYRAMTRFWTRIFGLVFAVGVGSGIVLEFQFGTNWAAYSRYVGDVFGSALAAEGIFAFFLESGFLAIVLFGWDRVRPGVHFLATCMVCLGAHFSAVWIIVANSWQQTPAGFHLVERGGGVRAEITSFWELVLNPSSVDRLIHVVLGAYLASAFLVISVSAYYLVKGRHQRLAVKSMKIGLVLALFASLAQWVSGHSSARVVVEHQPAKLAAMEGLYRTGPRSPLHLFGWVDERGERVWGLAVPGALSLLAHGRLDAPVTGLDQFAPEDRPPIQVTFQAFHLMVFVGAMLVALSALGCWLWWRKLWDPTGRPWVRAALWVLVLAVVLPQMANQLGWIVAEVGRQPWIVYGLLRTRDGLSAAVGPGAVAFSLALFAAIYLLLFALFLMLLDRKIREGPVLEAGPEVSAERAGRRGPGGE